MLKKILLAIVFVLVGFVGLSHAGGEIEIPEGYYNHPLLVKQWMEGRDLHTTLSNIQWNVAYRYSYFDCTERASLMEFVAENAGYEAWLGCDDTHCWLLVDYEGEIRAYDSMTFHVDQDKSRYYPRTHTYRYNPPYVYQTVHDLTPWEVDWWNVVEWHDPFDLTVSRRVDAWLEHRLRQKLIHAPVIPGRVE